MFFNTTVTRLRAVTKPNRAGDQVPDWSAPPARLPIPNVSVQPRVGDEQTDNVGDHRHQRAVIYTAPGTNPDVTALDRIDIDGQVWLVDGDPSRWPDPTLGGTHHLEIKITRTIG